MPAHIARSLANAAPTPFWLDQPDAPDAEPALAGHVTADLAVVGGGFTGLWAALLARERERGVATAGWQLDGIEEDAAAARALGHDVTVLDAGALRRELNSPLFVGGLKTTTGNALLEPARLAWGLRRACLDTGSRSRTPGAG